MKSGGILLREEEYRRVWGLLELFMSIEDFFSIIVVLWGGPGSGKTTLVRKIAADAVRVWRNLSVIYLSPGFKGPHGFFAGLQSVFELRGYSAVELMKYLSSNAFKLLIIIDNAERILNGDEEYQTILKIGEALNKNVFMLILFRSEHNPVDLKIIPQTFYPLYLRPFSIEEIRRILEDYSESRGNSIATKSALDLISRVAGLRGDAGLALRILEASLRIAEGNIADENHVIKVLQDKSSKAFIQNDIYDSHTEIVLSILGEQECGLNLRRLFEKYVNTAESHGLKPLRYTQFWKLIRRLGRMMMIDINVVSSKRGRRMIVRRCLS
ncbi:MAG: AAA family ATPase [Thermoproteota archaeon]